MHWHIRFLKVKHLKIRWLMKWAWDPACMTFSPTFGLKQEHHSQLKDETLTCWLLKEPLFFFLLMEPSRNKRYHLMQAATASPWGEVVSRSAAVHPAAFYTYSMVFTGSLGSPSFCQSICIFLSCIYFLLEGRQHRRVTSMDYGEVVAVNLRSIFMVCRW